MVEGQTSHGYNLPIVVVVIGAIVSLIVPAWLLLMGIDFRGYLSFHLVLTIRVMVVVIVIAFPMLVAFFYGGWQLGIVLSIPPLLAVWFAAVSTGIVLFWLFSVFLLIADVVAYQTLAGSGERD